MPRGPNGEQRPADVNSCAVIVAKIATGEIEEDLPTAHKRKAGRAGAASRTNGLSPERRSEIARNAARARWAG